MNDLSLDNLIYLLPAVLIALSLHEFAHGWVSYKLGDPTPKAEGRLTLNPLSHIDPFGTVSLLLFGFGWAKPVMVNPQYYKDRKSGMIWTAVAGPLMNFFVAFICMMIAGLILKLFMYSSNDIVQYLYVLMLITAQLNIGLGIFNLIPIPPLDGSKILAGMLPEDLYFKLMQYENIIGILLLVVLYAGILNGPLYHARSLIFESFRNVSYMLFGI